MSIHDSAERLGGPNRRAFPGISADGVVALDLPMDEHGPEGSKGTFHARALDDRLDLRSGEPESQ